MQLESIRPVADRLERYFDWYMHIDPDMTPQAVSIVSRFVRLASRRTTSPREARELLKASDGFTFGSAWEEMRAALLLLANA